MPNPHKIEHGRGSSWEYTYRVRGRMVRKRTRTQAEAVLGLAQATGRTASGSWWSRPTARSPWRSTPSSGSPGCGSAHSTRGSYESQLHRWILPALGDRPLTSLTRQDVLAFLAELDRSGLAPRSGNGTYRLLSSVLRSAGYDELLVKSPCYRIPLLPEVPRKLVLFTPDQAPALLAAARPQHRGVLAVTLGTGMRQGEAPGLGLPDVRLLQRELTVHRRDHGHARPPVPRRPRADQPGPRGAVREAEPVGPTASCEPARRHLRLPIAARRPAPPGRSSWLSWTTARGSPRSCCRRCSSGSLAATPRARAQGTSGRTTGSTGLGPAIVHAIVPASGGSVQMTSRSGQTAFLIRLPDLASSDRRSGRHDGETSADGLAQPADSQALVPPQPPWRP